MYCEVVLIDVLLIFSHKKESTFAMDLLDEYEKGLLIKYLMSYGPQTFDH